MIVFPQLGGAQHQPDATAVEERELRHLEQESHSERLAVELDGAADVAHANRDLSNAVERHLVRYGRCHRRLQWGCEISLALLTIMRHAEPPRKSRI